MLRKPSNYRLQFSLQTLFLLVTTCALVMPAIPPLIGKIDEWRHPKPPPPAPWSYMLNSLDY